MEYTRLGSTGMQVSRICLGCMGFGDATRWIHKWVLNEENSRPIIKKALELGINFFDTAKILLEKSKIKSALAKRSAFYFCNVRGINNIVVAINR